MIWNLSKLHVLFQCYIPETSSTNCATFLSKLQVAMETPEPKLKIDLGRELFTQLVSEGQQLIAFYNTMVARQNAPVQVPDPEIE